MTVKDVFTQKVVTCVPDTNLASAIALLWESDCGALPVLDGNGQVAGMLTDRHICIALGTKNIRASELTANDVMQTRVVSCGAPDQIRSALQILRRSDQVSNTVAA